MYSDPHIHTLTHSFNIITLTYVHRLTHSSSQMHTYSHTPYRHAYRLPHSRFPSAHTRITQTHMHSHSQTHIHTHPHSYPHSHIQPYTLIHIHRFPLTFSHTHGHTCSLSHSCALTQPLAALLDTLSHTLTQSSQLPLTRRRINLESSQAERRSLDPIRSQERFLGSSQETQFQGREMSLLRLKDVVHVTALGESARLRGSPQTSCTRSLVRSLTPDLHEGGPGAMIGDTQWALVLGSSVSRGDAWAS